LVLCNHVPTFIHDRHHYDSAAEALSARNALHITEVTIKVGEALEEMQRSIFIL
jgi:hypothetical protein